MKTYEEVAKSVFEKSEKYFEEKAIRAKRIKTAVTAMSCFCLAAVLVVGAVAAFNGNLTEPPLSGGAGNNSGIPAVDETTTAETESLYTMPDILTDENGDPIYPDIDIPDEMWEAHGGYSFGSGIPGDISAYNWQTRKEILGADYGIKHYDDVYVGFFLAYDGALYVSYTPPENKKADRRYALTGKCAYFGENSPCEVYAVKDEPNLEPNLIAIKINFAIHEYRRVLNFNFGINGEEFKIAYNASLDIDHACGDIVLQGDDFTVYEAERLQGVPSDAKEYLINLLPVIKKEIPNWDDAVGDKDYPSAYFPDAWWVALPADTAEMLSHVDIQDDIPSFPPNALSGVTPADIDKILAEIKTAPYVTPYSSVFVQANIGDEVYSLTDGVVVMEGWDRRIGKTIIVQTTDGDYIMYCHLSEIFVKKGDTAARGKVIGLTGNTGDTSYPGVVYSVITFLPTPEKCAVIFPEIPEERTEAELIEEIDKLGISVTFVWTDDVDERIIPMEENAEVFSLTDGEVVWTNKYGNYDSSVCVQYSEDTFVYYNHLGSLNVKIGDTVAEGQCIGRAGDIEFIDSIFDFGAGYRLSHTPPPVLSLNSLEP